MEKLKLLINTLCSVEHEAPWIEFKHDNYEPFMIGKDISALANSATLYEKEKAYMVWGINNDTHEITGTTHDLQSLKKGNEELGNWLRHQLSSNSSFDYHIIPFENDNNELVNVGLLIIDKAVFQPVTFEKNAYIRSGSYTKKLNDFPTLQSQLWNRLQNTSYEDLYAKTDLMPRDILQLLDYVAYFDIKKVPVPTDSNEIIHYLTEEDIIKLQDNGMFAITNLGALLFAKSIDEFNSIKRKAIRIVQYEGKNKIKTLKEKVISKGYAAGFEDLLNYISALIPTEEIISSALREEISSYPIIAIREAVANALIHQDLSITGTSPLIEIFDNRIEITNPGVPLVDINRIIDNPPKSRNERLAELMRRLRICEELGTGWDKIVIACELMKLPAPKILLYQENTRVILFRELPFTNISPEDKLWACYLHACIKQVQGDQLTNKSLRERFGLKESSAASVSRLIKDALGKNLIKPLDQNTAPRYMKYLPFWA